MSDTVADTLPPVQIANLSSSALDELFFDIGHAAELVSIAIKARAQGYAEGGRMSLEDARRVLDTASALGVQLRYRFGSKLWCDTLLCTPAGIRLVRVEI